MKPGDPMRGKPRWVLAGLGRSDAQGGSLDLDKIEAALQRGCLGLSGPHGHLRDQRLYIINSLVRSKSGVLRVFCIRPEVWKPLRCH